jgi:hypothetical protein
LLQADNLKEEEEEEEDEGENGVGVAGTFMTASGGSPGSKALLCEADTPSSKYER